MSETTIIQIQDAAVKKILGLRSYGESPLRFLGKLPRSLSAIRRSVINQAQQLGATEKQAIQQWKDVRDMAELEYHAEE